MNLQEDIESIDVYCKENLKELCGELIDLYTDSQSFDRRFFFRRLEEKAVRVFGNKINVKSYIEKLIIKNAIEKIAYEKKESEKSDWEKCLDRFECQNPYYESFESKIED